MQRCRGVFGKKNFLCTGANVSSFPKVKGAEPKPSLPRISVISSDGAEIIATPEDNPPQRVRGRQQGVLLVGGDGDDGNLATRAAFPSRFKIVFQFVSVAAYDYEFEAQTRCLEFPNDASIEVKKTYAR